MNTATLPPAHHTAFARQIEATFVPECTPTYTLERQVAEARALMGEAKWQRLMAEWDSPPYVALVRGDEGFERAGRPRGDKSATPVLADLQGRAG